MYRRSLDGTLAKPVAAIFNSYTKYSLFTSVLEERSRFPIILQL
jgi:hypothetical protein